MNRPGTRQDHRGDDRHPRQQVRTKFQAACLADQVHNQREAAEDQHGHKGQVIRCQAHEIPGHRADETQEQMCCQTCECQNSDDFRLAETRRVRQPESW